MTSLAPVGGIASVVGGVGGGVAGEIGSLGGEDIIETRPRRSALPLSRIALTPPLFYAGTESNWAARMPIGLRRLPADRSTDAIHSARRPCPRTTWDSTIRQRSYLGFTRGSGSRSAWITPTEVLTVFTHGPKTPTCKRRGIVRALDALYICTSHLEIDTRVTRSKDMRFAFNSAPSLYFI